MSKLIIFSNVNKTIFNIILGFLLSVYFYKLYLEFNIPILSDELNSILVYSTNIKTLFLKNYPGNVTLFHLFGYLKSLFLGYELATYRIITFIFVLLHFGILKKLKFDEIKISIFFCLLLVSNFSLYAGLYIGYVFSSFIFISLYYLIIINQNEKYNKIIFFLFFVQLYNHLVNIYLVLPMIISIFIFSNKKKFLKEFFIFFIIPLSFFYSVSIILTGLSAIKISDLSYLGVLEIFENNFLNILVGGFKGIFFHGFYQSEFKITNTVKLLYQYDKFILFFFLISFVISIINVIYRKNLFFSSIIIMHILLFFILNKQPPPRIFVGFYCFYILFFFNSIDSKYSKIISNKFNLFKILFVAVLSFLILKFDYSRLIKNNDYAYGVTHKENIISLKILNKDCYLYDDNFSQVQKQNFYFNYINKCEKKFNLQEFLNYYRS